MSDQILLDTIALWGLIFVNSKFHKPATEIVKGKHVFIHSACLHELIYPAYKLESRGGRDIIAGLRLIIDVKRSYNSLIQNYSALFGISRLTILPLTPDDLLGAFTLILNEPEIFVEKRDGCWPSVVDAIVAFTWENLRIPLATNDRKLMKYGDKHNLPYIALSTTPAVPAKK